jgi:hypothetical protein
LSRWFYAAKPAKWAGEIEGRFRVASGIRGKGIMIVLALLVLAVLAYAWIDAGRTPLRDIAVPVAVPVSVAGA